MKLAKAILKAFSELHQEKFSPHSATIAGLQFLKFIFSFINNALLRYNKPERCWSKEGFENERKCGPSTWEKE